MTASCQVTNYMQDDFKTYHRTPADYAGSLNK